ncbi:MAG: copper oxidase [Hyphomonadaceae bacterium]|jgi:FtsP/CotA-like multicopper oxidase with cupredoxin domain|nr:copper oxidase [Hyphomonadaceae bacterium]
MSDDTNLTRREALAASAAVLAGTALAGPQATAQVDHSQHKGMPGMKKPETAPPPPAAGSGAFVPPTANSFYARTIDAGTAVAPGEPGKDYTPTITPNGVTLPFKIVNGVKVFHLIAEEVTHELAPGLKAKLWGYNGRVHGPTIEAVEGDRVRIYVTNKLQAPTSVHWHGLHIPSGMDGVGGLNQKSIGVGETFKYEYSLWQHGTFMYHSHHDEMTQMAMGLMGMFIIHPRRPKGPRVDRDFVLLLSQWEIRPGTYRPDITAFAGFNTLTINARSYPGTEPLVAKKGDRVRLRIGNLSAIDHHPIHIHGHSFQITETDGGVVPESGRQPETTVLVSVGQTRSVDFVADNPGDWALHCHMTHHVMNQMGHAQPVMIGVRENAFKNQVKSVLPGYMTMGQAGMADMAEHATAMGVPDNSIPMLGAEGPLDYITMGGMFTILKVREGLTSYADPGWYPNPPGTLASLATSEDLKRDGITL